MSSTTRLGEGVWLMATHEFRPTPTLQTCCAEGAAVFTFREPPVSSPGFSRSGPPEGGTPYRWHDPDGFMVPMHGIKVVRAFHEPTRPNTPPRRGALGSAPCQFPSWEGVGS